MPALHPHLDQRLSRHARHSDTGQNIVRTDPTALAIIDGPATTGWTW
jgi:hypothetical protein